MSEAIPRKRRVPLGLMGVSECSAKPGEYFDAGHVFSFDKDTVTIIQMAGRGGGMIMYPRGKDGVKIRLISKNSQPRLSNVVHLAPHFENLNSDFRVPKVQQG